MINLEELLASAEIKEEYHKTFLLCIFQKICVKMDQRPTFKQKIFNLYRESYNFPITIQQIIQKELKQNISTDEAKLVATWVEANLKKSSRKHFPLSTKQALYKKQNGKCMVCGEKLGNDWSKIHVDHIIPFKLVGDELPDNYQDLCDMCNSYKSARTDFVFKSMLKLI